VLRHVSSPLGEGNPRHDDISHGTSTFLKLFGAAGPLTNFLMPWTPTPTNVLVPQPPYQWFWIV
jgi:hypothetical protein